MILNRSATKQEYVQCIVSSILALLAVVIRFIARARSGAKFGADDLFMLMSLVAFLAYNSAAIYCTSLSGAGVPYAELPLPVLIPNLKVLYANVILTVITISAAKFSVLCLYHRLFSVDQAFRRALIVVGLVSLGWFLACFLMAILRCIPVRAAWEPLIPAKCYNVELAFAVTESVNCVTDFVIVFLSTLVLRKLHMPLRHKIGISLIFMLGGFVVLTSILRIIYTYKPASSSDALLSTNLWVVIQLSCAIICGCLPVCKPVLPRLDSVLSGFDSVMSLLARRTKSSPTASNNTPGDFSYHVWEPTRRAFLDRYENLSEDVALTEVDNRQGSIQIPPTEENIAVTKDVLMKY